MVSLVHSPQTETAMPTLRAAIVLAALFPTAALAQPAANPSFTLENRAGVAIKQFFATPGGRANWGRDRLDGRGLAAGAREAFRLPADGNCVYDLRVVFADGRAEDRRGLNTCQVKNVAVGEPVAAARTFRLLNHGPVPVTEIAARAQGTDQWRTDHLPAGPIAPGSERNLALPPGGQCVFDLRVTFADGKTHEKHAADLCKSPDQAVQ
jgi:hypothetical protein